jgi:nucleoside-diphosphate-sugar epimerase
MSILVTGAGLIGTGFAREAIARGEEVIFLDPEPRADYLKFKLGDKGYRLIWGDIRDLPALVAAMTDNKVSAVVHTAGLIAQCRRGCSARGRQAAGAHEHDGGFR